MATIRLVPSTYYLSNRSYLSVSNASNMYADTDSETYATVTNSRSSTSSYYIYLRGFNFDDIPANAIINDFRILLKARESGVSTSSSYRPILASGTSTYSNAYCTAISTTATAHEFSFTQSLDTFISAGSNFGIRINCRRASSGTTSYMYIYGAEIEIDYTIPVSATVTSTLSGDGTISPSGATSTYEGAEYELTITPTNKSDTVTATKNGVDITSQLVAHGAGSTSTFTASDVQLTDIQSGSSYAEYAIGHTAESPYSSTSNMYASSTGYAEYSFDFSSIPSNATIEDIEVRCYGHRESATIDSTHMSRVELYRGSTAISDAEEFQSQSSTTVTLVPTDMPTRAELDSVIVRHTVGYYGGLVTGISFEVTYSTGTGIDHYTYTYTVDGNATIAVTIGGGSSTQLYIKEGGSWVTYSKLYQKVNGTWTAVSDPSSVLDTNVNYVKVN